MTLRDNSLRSTETRFALILPPEELGSIGFRFVRATVETEVGDEVLLVLTEDAQYIDRYDPATLTLTANSGVLKTQHGTIGAVVWHIGAGGRAEAYIEQFLSPAAPATKSLIEEAARQARLKLVILYNRTSEVRLLVEYHNTFGFEELMPALEARKAEWKSEEFGEARVWAKHEGNLIAQSRAGTLDQRTLN